MTACRRELGQSFGGVTRVGSPLGKGAASHGAEQTGSGRRLISSVERA